MNTMRRRLARPPRIGRAPVTNGGRAAACAVAQSSLVLGRANRQGPRSCVTSAARAMKAPGSQSISAV
ncbi:MAG: hypothetical protein WBY94_27960 [Polyangiaceae bacterium]